MSDLLARLQSATLRVKLSPRDELKPAELTLLGKMKEQTTPAGLGGVVFERTRGQEWPAEYHTLWDLEARGFAHFEGLSTTEDNRVQKAGFSLTDAGRVAFNRQTKPYTQGGSDD